MRKVTYDSEGNIITLFTYSINTTGAILIYGLTAQSRIAFNTTFRAV